MRVRVRRLSKVALSVRARVNAKGASVVPGGKGYIALVLVASVLTACGGRPSPSPTGTSTALSPSPTGTSLALSPSPTGTSLALSPSPTSTASTCVTSSPTGTCGYYTNKSAITMSAGNSYAANNCWADPSCAQTLRANSPGDWQVTSTEPAGNTSVKTGPELQQQTNNWCAAENTWQNLTKNGCGGNPLSDVPISALYSFTSTYSESMPHNGQTVAEAAYDIWTNYKTDIMIWLDNVNRARAAPPRSARPPSAARTSPSTSSVVPTARSSSPWTAEAAPGRSLSSPAGRWTSSACWTGYSRMVMPAT